MLAFVYFWGAPVEAPCCNDHIIEDGHVHAPGQLL